jgi:hypothetical protein
LSTPGDPFERTRSNEFAKPGGCIPRIGPKAKAGNTNRIRTTGLALFVQARYSQQMADLLFKSLEELAPLRPNLEEVMNQNEPEAKT